MKIADGDFGGIGQRAARPAPAISVVIPAYDRAATIRGAVESVLAQSWGDLEVIVVDDASRDGTFEVAAAIADPRVRVISSPRNAGVSAARNIGIEDARGDWVAFQDSDDEWLPLKLEKQMARVAEDPEAGHVAVYCGMLILGAPTEAAPGAGRLTARYFPGPEDTELEGEILLPLLRKSLISTQTLVARRDRLLEIGGFDPRLPALVDWDCALRLAPLGPIAFVDEPLVVQRFSPNSITRDSGRRLRARVRIAEKHKHVLGGHPEILAGHHYAIAGGHRALGDLPAARAALGRARAVWARNARIWAMSAYVAALSLRPRLPKLPWPPFQAWASARPASRASK